MAGCLSSGVNCIRKTTMPTEIKYFHPKQLSSYPFLLNKYLQIKCFMDYRIKVTVKLETEQLKITRQ